MKPSSRFRGLTLLLIVLALLSSYLVALGPYCYFNELSRFGTTKNPARAVFAPALFLCRTPWEIPLRDWAEFWRQRAISERKRGYFKARREAVEEMMRAGAVVDKAADVDVQP